MSDSVKVVVRVRPLINRENDCGAETNWVVEDKQIRQKNGNGKPYCFDEVFDQPSTTEDVYVEVAVPIVRSVMDGFNGTIFAYGQTASGKTFTMMGNERNPGIIPRAINEIFDVIESEVTREFLIRVSYMEIYNENVLDLLCRRDKRKNLEVREDMNGQVFVSNLEEIHVSGHDQIIGLMKAGENNRHFGVTNMNERSSRSHTIFRMVIEGRERTSDPRKSVDGAVRVAHLNLVDLAGSEKARQTGASGQRLAEGGFINKSLFTLGQVIGQLSDSASFINYRDSKLTRILQNALGGNSKTVIISNVTPAAIDETHSTLRFATSARSIKNKPIQNEVLSDEALLKRYKHEINRLKKQLTGDAQRTENQELLEKLEEKEKMQQEQEEKIESLKRFLLVSSHAPGSQEMNKKHRRQTWCPGKARLSFMPSQKKSGMAGDLEFPSFNPLRRTLQSMEETLSEGPEDVEPEDKFGLDDDSISGLKKKTMVSFASDEVQVFSDDTFYMGTFDDKECQTECTTDENTSPGSSVNHLELSSLQSELRNKDQQLSDITLNVDNLVQHLNDVLQQKNSQIEGLQNQVITKDSTMESLNQAVDCGFEKQMEREELLHGEIYHLRQKMSAIQADTDRVFTEPSKEPKDLVAQLQTEKATAEEQNMQMCQDFADQEIKLRVEIDTLRSRVRELESADSSGNTVNTSHDPDLLAKMNQLEEANEALQQDQKKSLAQLEGLQDDLEEREGESITLVKRINEIQSELDKERSKANESGSNKEFADVDELRKRIVLLEEQNQKLVEDGRDEMEMMTMKICQLEEENEQLVEAKQSTQVDSTEVDNLKCLVQDLREQLKSVSTANSASGLDSEIVEEDGNNWKQMASELDKQKCELETLVAEFKNRDEVNQSQLNKLQTKVYELQEQNENLQGEFSEEAILIEMEQLRSKISELEDERLDVSLVNVNDSDTLIIERDMFKARVQELEAEKENHEIEAQNNVALLSELEQCKLKIFELEFESERLAEQSDNDDVGSSELNVLRRRTAVLQAENDKLTDMKARIDSSSSNISDLDRNELMEAITLSEDLMKENSQLRESNKKMEKELITSQTDVHKLLMEKDTLSSELEELNDFTRLETDFRNASIMEKKVSPVAQNVSLNNSGFFRSPRVAVASKKLLEEAVEENKSLSDELGHLKKALKSLGNEKNDLESQMEIDNHKFCRREKELREQLEQAYNDLQTDGTSPPIRPPTVSTDDKDVQTIYSEESEELKAELVHMQEELERTLVEKSQLERDMDEQINLAIDNQGDLLEKQNMIKELQLEVNQLKDSKLSSTSDTLNEDSVTTQSELQKEKEGLTEKLKQLEWEKSKIQQTMDKMIEANEADHVHFEQILVQKDDLQKEKQSLLEQLKDMEKLRKEKDELLEQLKGLDTSRFSLDETIDKSSKVDSQLSDISSERDKLNEEKVSLMEQLESLQVDKDNLIGQLQTLSSLQQERDSLVEQLQTMNVIQQEKEELMEQLQLLSSKQQEMHGVPEELLSMSALQQEKDELLEQLQTLKCVQQEKDELLEQLQSLTCVQQEREKLMEQLQSLKCVQQEKDELLEQLQSLTCVQKEKEDLMEQLKSLTCVQQEKEDLLEQLQSLTCLQNEKEELLEQLQSLTCVQQEKETLMAQLDKQLSENKTLQEAASEMEKQLVDASGQLSEFKNTVSLLEKRLNKSTRDSVLISTSDTYDDLRDRYEKLLAESTQTQGKLLSEANRDLDVQKTIEELKKERKDAIQSFSSMNKENQDIIDKLNKDIYELRCQLQKAQGEESLAIHKLKKTEEENESLKQELRMLEDIQMKHDVPRGRQELDPEKMADKMKKMGVSLDLTNQRCQKAEAKAKELEVIARKAEDAMFTRDHLQRLLRDQEQAMKEKQTELSAVQQRYSGSYAEIAQLKMHADSLKDQLDQNKAQIVSMQDQLGDAAGEREQLLQQKNQLLEQIKDIDTQAADSRRELNQLREQNTAQHEGLLCDMEQLQNEKHELTEQITKLGVEKGELTSALDALTSMKDTDSSRITELESEIESLQKNCLQLQEEKQEKELHLQNTTQQLEQLSQQNDILQKNLTKNEQSLKEEKENAQNAEEIINNQLRECENNLELIKGEKEALISDNRELSNKISHLEQLQREREQLVEELQSNLSCLKDVEENCEELRQKLIDMEAARDALQEELCHERGRLQGEVTKLKEQLDEMTRSKDELMQSIDQITDSSSASNVKLDMLSCERDSLLLERDTLIKKLEENVTEHDELVKSFDNLVKEKCTVEQQLSEKVEELDRYVHEHVEELRERDSLHAETEVLLSRLVEEKNALENDKSEKQLETEQLLNEAIDEKDTIKQQHMESVSKHSEIKELLSRVEKDKNTLEQEKSLLLEQLQAVDDLEREKHKLRVQVSELESEKEDLLQQEQERLLEQLSASEQSLNEKDKLVEDITKLTMEREQLLEQLIVTEDLQREKQDLISQLTEKDGINNEMEALLAALTQERNKLKEEHADLLDQVNVAKSEAEQLQVGLSDTENKLTTEIDKSTQLEMKLQAAVTEMDCLKAVQNESSTASQELLQFKITCSQLQDDVDKLKDEHSSKDTEIENLKSELSTLKTDKELLTEQNDEMKNLFVEYDAELESKRKQANVAESKVQTIQCSAQKEFAELQEQKTEALKRISVTEDKYQKLQDELETVRRESILNTTVTLGTADDRDSLLKQLKRQEDRNFELQKEIGHLKFQMDEPLNELDELQVKYDLLEDKYEDLLNSRNTGEEAPMPADVAEQVKRLEKHNFELVKEMGELKFKMDEPYNELDELQMKYELLEDKHEDLMLAVEQAKKSNETDKNDLLESIKKLSNSKQSLEDEIYNLKKQINEATKPVKPTPVISELQAKLDNITQDNVKKMLRINFLETELRREAEPLKEEITSQKETIGYLEEKLQYFRNMARKNTNELSNASVLCQCQKNKSGSSQSTTRPEEPGSKVIGGNSGSGAINSLQFYTLRAEKDALSKENTKLRSRLTSREGKLSELEAKIEKYKTYYKKTLVEDEKSVLKDMANSPKASRHDIGFDSWVKRASTSTAGAENWLAPDKTDDPDEPKQCPQQ